MSLIYRVQDMKGRGPYRPGMPDQWSDEGHIGGPAFYQEFGFEVLDERQDGEWMGCGFQTMEQARRWFTPTERIRLWALGYRLVAVDVDRVLRASAVQMVFAHGRPLRDCATEVPETLWLDHAWAGQGARR